MAHRTFRLPFLICCDTCSLEFFGASGEEQARDHARKSGHQVRINALVRETLNEAGPDIIPEYVSVLDTSTNEQRQRRIAALARLEAIYGVTP